VTTAAGAASRPIAGPTALGSDPRRLWRLAWTIATTDFKLRFFGSALGYLWQLMRPLLLFAIIYIVFVEILKVGGDQPLFGVALLLGIVMYQFFTDATAGSVRSIIIRESLVRKVDFPRMAVPLSVVLQALFNLGLNLIPVFVFLLAAGGTLSVRWLELPLIVLMLVVFVSGLAMLLSSLFVRYRDVEPIWDVVTQALFYATPILYSLSVVIDKAGIEVARLMLVNPLAAAIQQARHAIIDPAYESAGQVFGTTAGDLLPIAVSIITFIVGFIVFDRAAPKIAELL
jgi:ABC-2 type transport system permease protein